MSDNEAPNTGKSRLAEPHANLLNESRRALAYALFRTMQVAGKTDDGYPTKLGQEALAAKAGVARSTIAKYLSAKDADESVVNPDLETVCKLATALNIPPGFLLLTPSDWSKLAQAVTEAAASVQDSVVKKLIADLEKDGFGSAYRGQTGLRLAQRLGVHPTTDWNAANSPKQDIPTRWHEAQEETRQRSQLGILSATALPPIREVNAEQRTILLSLCALIGASTNVK